jgi:hypothetical protein
VIVFGTLREWNDKKKSICPKKIIKGKLVVILDGTISKRGLNLITPP